jgi:uncharacterized membrane protein
MLNSLRTHPRLFLGALLGIIVGLLLPPTWPQSVRMIAGWDFAAGLYLVLAWIMILRWDAARVQLRARLEDDGRWAILVISAGSAATSLGAIVKLLANFKDLPDFDKPLNLSLAVSTLLLSWFFLHTVFTIHYAHEFYGAAPDGGSAERKKTRGGFAFPGDAKAWGYLDFAYYAFTIGMTAQTSDIAVTTTAMRRLTLAHAILTFFFNTVVLAFSVNIAASLL